MDATPEKTMDKILKRLMLLLVMTLGLTFASCGGGDDDKDDGDKDIVAPKSELVGKWESSDSNWGMKLNSDGKGFEYEAPGNYDPESWAITWKYKNDILTLTDGDGDKEILKIEYLDEDMMIYSWVDDGGSYSDGDEHRTMFKVRKFSWE